LVVYSALRSSIDAGLFIEKLMLEYTQRAYEGMMVEHHPAPRLSMAAFSIASPTAPNTYSTNIAARLAGNLSDPKELFAVFGEGFFSKGKKQQ